MSEHHRVVVVGAGFAGVGASIALATAGVPHVVLERASEVGGTWRDNRYPGCRCDVPSALYSYSFAPNPDWSETYSPQAEIQAYLRGVASSYGVDARVRFDTELLDASWTGSSWSLRTSTGELSADVLVLANGPLAEPALPDIPGLASFAGTTFHSARWPEPWDPTGRRVGVVGTGSSAVQFVPRIQPFVDALTVFQRTPAWVIPHRTHPVSARRRRLYRRVPLTQKAVRAWTYAVHELYGLAMVRNRTDAIEKLARGHLAAQVADPSLRAALTPTFKPGCKRLLLSDDWYPALPAENASLVTERITSVVPQGVVTADGRTHELDTLILGTGFRVLDNPIYERVHGADGRSLAARWSGTTPRAYLGATVPGFPNLFQLAGPNTGIGHTSLLVMIEAQLRYLVDALATMDRLGAVSVDVRRPVYDRWDRELRTRSAPTVWATGGCSSWYLDAEGGNGAVWPDLTFRFRRRTRRFDARSYEVVG